ncbi:MAG TPA: phosphoribosyltransferase family protein [Acidimicrobiales bacterium]
MFADRTDAGRRLAAKLVGLGVVDRAAADVVVLALPRGGVPVGAEVARAVGCPLDVLLVRKLGAPSQPELAMGAIGEQGVRIVNEAIMRALRVSEDDLRSVEERERAELARRAGIFRRGRAPVPVDGRLAIVVDDGIATGATARAGCEAARLLGAARVVLAVPVAASASIDELAAVAEVVCVEPRRDLYSVGESYRDFTQTTDDEVVALLDSSTG